MPIFIIVFLALTLLWILYWAIIRPSFLDAAQDDLLALKHQVEWSIINDVPGSRSQPAQALLKEIDAASCARWISFSHIVVGGIWCRATIKAEVEKEKTIFENSPKWVRDVKEQLAMISLKSVIANSPIWWIPLPAILLAAIFSKKVSNWWCETRAVGNMLRVAEVAELVS